MFNIRQRLQNSRLSWYDKTEARVKYAIYSIMHELLQCQINFPLFFNILLLIEAGQFLWYAIHPDYDFLWKTSLAQYPRDMIKFFQVDSLLREGDSSTYYAFLYIGFAIQLVMFLSVILVLFLLEKAKKKTSSLVFYTLRLLSFYAQLLTTIGPIPLVHIFTVAIICREDDSLRGNVQCYTGVHLVNMSVGIFGMVTTLIFSFLTTIFYIDLNPSSNLPLAAPQSGLPLLKLLLKIALPFYITLDNALENGKIFVAVYSGIWLVFLVLRYTSQGYYNNMVTIFATATESLVFWGALVATFHAFIDSSTVDDIGIFYFLIAAPFVAYTYYVIFIGQKWRHIRSNTKRFKKPIQFEKYINTIIQLVENRENEEDGIVLEGILRYHVKYCKNSSLGCPCTTMAVAISKDEENVDEKKSWYHFIKTILEEGLISFPKSSRLHLQHAYFQQEKLQNKFKALYELVITEERRPNIQEEFSIFRYMNIIEKEMIEEDIRKTDSRGIDINMIVHFQEKLVSLQGEIGKAVNMQLDFWRELEQTNPNVQKLLSLGSRITIQADVVKSSYQKIYELNSNHIRMLRMYGNFLLKVLNDNFEAQRVIEKADYAERSVAIDKNFVDNDRLKYSENSKTCIINCSANLHSIGKVLSANNESLDVLDYPHTELIGQNINQIMPSIIADIHDNLMKKYFETSIGRVMGKERIVFPMTKSGYITPCTLMIKIFPNLDEGIRVVGFLKKVDFKSSDESNPSNSKTHYIQYGGEDNVIVGISHNCYDSFGIPPSLTKGDNRDFTIQAIFPDLLDQNKEELKSTTGLVCTIDTTNLPQNFLVGREDSEETDEDESTKQKRYRTSKDDVYLEKVNVHVLKFVELSDNDAKTIKSDVVGPDQSKHTNKSTEHAGSASDFDGSRSEASNVSMGSSIGEDVRQLKDMKAKISEKNVPSSISALQKISLVLIAGLITIVGIQLDKRISMNDDLWSGLIATKMSYRRYDILAQINRNIRNIDLMAKNMIQHDATIEQTTRTRTEELIEKLNTIQFNVIQEVANINQTMGIEISEPLQIRRMLQDGSVLTDVRGLNKGIYEYVSAAQKLNNLDLNAFLQPLGATSAQMPFYFLKRNGLSSIREATQNKAYNIFDIYLDRTDDFSEFSLITMIVAIVFLVLSEAVIIPKIFSVNKTNMKVLSLFGYIPPEEVDEFAEKCETYMEEYLDELTAKRNDSYYDSEEELEKTIQQPDNSNKNLKKRMSNMGESQDESGQQNYSMQMKEFPDREDPSQSQIKLKSPKNNLLLPGTVQDTAQVSHKSVEDDKSIESPLNRITGVDNNNNNNGVAKTDEKDKDNKDNEKDKEKDDKDKEEDEEHLYYLHERSKKLRNSKDNNKGVVMLQAMAFGLIFIGYFVGDYIHERFFMTNFKQGLEHLKIISERRSNMKYTFLFSLEEISENNLSVVYPDVASDVVTQNNYRIQYSDKVYQNQMSVKETFKKSFPGSFNDYLNQLRDFNNEDVCQLFYVSDLTAQAILIIIKDCKLVAGGEISRGLIQSEVMLVENTKAVLKQFYGVPTRTNQTQVDTLASDNFENAAALTDNLDPIMEFLIDNFLGAFQSYFDQMFLYQRLKFLLFFCALIVLFLFVWLPYLRRLTKQIFRTKGLLNMIPMEMLQKKKSLRETFTSPEILAAIK